MRYILIVFSFMSASLMSAQVNMEASSLEDALKRAKQEKKSVFIYAYTTWCEPCEEMESYTFTDLEVSNFWNKNFVTLALDMERYPGVELAEKYDVSFFPGFLFLDDKEELVHRSCGGMDATEFLRLGESAVGDADNLLSLERRYEAGERSRVFMLQYLNLMEYACQDAEQFASDYLEEVTLEKLLEETPWAVIASYQWDIYSREFQYLIKNKQAFEVAIGREAVNAKIYDTYLAQYQEVYQSEELHDFGMRALIYELDRIDFLGADTLRLMVGMHYAEYSRDWTTYAVKAIELVGMMNIEDAEELSELAWNFYLFIEDRNQLAIASGWAKDAVDKLPNPSVIDTYASIQFKLGEKKKAVVLEERALELAQELGEDLSHYKYQLEKFRKKQ